MGQATEGSRPAGRGQASFFVARLVALALLLALAACTAPLVTLPDVVRPTGPLDLDAATALALRNNPDVTAADARVQAARAGVDLAESQFWPSLRLGIGASRVEQPSRAFGSILDQGRFKGGIDFNDPGPITSVQTQLGFGWTLYDGGRRRAAARASEAELGAASATADEVRADLALQVARAYFLVHQAQQTAATRRLSIEALESQLRLVQARVDEGAARLSELLAVRVRLAETHEALIVAENAARRGMATMHVLLALPLVEPLELLFDDEASAAPGDVPTLVELLERAYAARPELVRAQLAIDAAEARLDAAAAGWVPDLGLSAALSVDDPALLQGAVHWLAGIGLVDDLTEAARTPKRVSQAAAGLRAVLADARRTALEVEYDVESARLDALEASARLDVASETVALADEQMQRTEAEYEGGVATITRLIDAEQALADARARRVAAQDDRALAQLALRHAVGELVPRDEARASDDDAPDDVAQPGTTIEEHP
ncbi:MAG: TolC family protein [Planctomycetes bacterium]|nr:TolC family protein [Planctomycetota bacterium]